MRKYTMGVKKKYKEYSTVQHRNDTKSALMSSYSAQYKHNTTNSKFVCVENPRLTVHSVHPVHRLYSLLCLCSEEVNSDGWTLKSTQP